MKTIKIITLVVLGVTGIALGIIAQRPAIMLIPAYLLGKAYRAYKTERIGEEKK